MSRAAKRPRRQDNNNNIESNSNASSGLPTELWSKVLQCKYNVLFCSELYQLDVFKIKVYVL